MSVVEISAREALNLNQPLTLQGDEQPSRYPLETIRPMSSLHSLLQESLCRGTYNC